MEALEELVVFVETDLHRIVPSASCEGTAYVG